MPERICYKDFILLVDIPVLYLFFTSMWALQIRAYFFFFFLNFNIGLSPSTFNFVQPFSPLDVIFISLTVLIMTHEASLVIGDDGKLDENRFRVTLIHETEIFLVLLEEKNVRVF